MDTKYIFWIIYLIENIFRNISHHFKSLFRGNSRLVILGELAEKEGDPHGEEDEEYFLDTKYIVWIIY